MFETQRAIDHCMKRIIFVYLAFSSNILKSLATRSPGKMPEIHQVRGFMFVLKSVSLLTWSSRATTRGLVYVIFA